MSPAKKYKITKAIDYNQFYIQKRIFGIWFDLDRHGSPALTYSKIKWYDETTLSDVIQKICEWEKINIETSEIEIINN